VEPKFKKLCDDFVARVQSTNIVAETQVVLVYHCVGVDGNEIPDVRIDIDTPAKVTIPGNPERAREWALSLFRDTIMGNIRSLVLYVGDTPFMVRDGPPYPIVVRDMSLEIIQPVE
jgi:hypothetical protein